MTKRHTTRFATNFSLIAILLAAGGLALSGCSRKEASEQGSGKAAATRAAPRGEKGKVWTCPMHPQIRKPGPGRCPICGMNLVPEDQVRKQQGGMKGGPQGGMHQGGTKGGPQGGMHQGGMQSGTKPGHGQSGQGAPARTGKAGEK